MGIAQKPGGLPWMWPAREDDCHLWLGNHRVEAPVVIPRCRGQCSPGLPRTVTLGKGHGGSAHSIQTVAPSPLPAVTASSLCPSLSQAPPLQPPLLRLSPGLALRLAATAADHRPVHSLHGSCAPEGLQRGGRAEEGVRVPR